MSHSAANADLGHAARCQSLPAPLAHCLPLPTWVLSARQALAACPVAAAFRSLVWSLGGGCLAVCPAEPKASARRAVGERAGRDAAVILKIPAQQTCAPLVSRAGARGTSGVGPTAYLGFAGGVGCRAGRGQGGSAGGDTQVCGGMSPPTRQAISKRVVGVV